MCLKHKERERIVQCKSLQKNESSRDDVIRCIMICYLSHREGYARLCKARYIGIQKKDDVIVRSSSRATWEGKGCIGGTT